MRRYLGLTLASLVLLVAGCNHTPAARTDAQIASDVQNKINSDNNLPDKQVTINANSGVVTLTGNVSSDQARNAAATDAAQVEGVKTVVNNLQVAPATASNTEPEAQQPEQSNPEPQRPEKSRATTRKSSPSHRDVARNSSDNGDNGLRTTVPATSNSSASSGNNPGGNSYDSAANTPPAAPTPLPKITVPAGTQLSIRINDELNSETAQVGDVFHGSVSTPVTVDGKTVIPTTADVEGRVVDVKSAGRFKGQSDLVIELTSLKMNGKSYQISSDRWSKQGNGRGKATAAKVGGGAALGAVLGGIFGGGKGAAIGAAAGAGAGTGVSAATKGQQIILKPETVLSFQLQSPITVQPGATRQAMNE
ncbi:MAG TPA: BON domain-containing protein [Candidatus Angelobacter sp.]|nr:BON domain-containing protein [Candidatus Angelobacter sp.]